MTDKMKKGQISFLGQEPMKLDDAEDIEITIPPELQAVVRDVGRSVVAYLHAAKDLLTNRLSHLREWAPTHLADPGAVLVVCCPDGVVIRYEMKSEKNENKVYGGWMPESLPQIV